MKICIKMHVKMISNFLRDIHLEKNEWTDEKLTHKNK